MGKGSPETLGKILLMFAELVTVQPGLVTCYNILCYCLLVVNDADIFKTFLRFWVELF